MGEPLSPGPFQSWDDFRFFLATTKAGSFSKAASDLGVTQPTISRRIENLEQRLGVRLFDRLPNGVALTSEGESILESAHNIERMVLEITRSVYGSDRRMEGTVRISLTDGLATYWITPRLPAFHEKHDSIAVELLCSIEPADALKMETDLSVRFGQPQEPELIAVKLATAHFVLWASPGYIARHGAPQSVNELLQHSLLDHVAYTEEHDGDWSDWLALARAANLIRYRSNSSSALLSAVQSGLGIGMLPTYSADCVDGVVPLDLDLRTKSEIWLAYHPSLQHVPRVRAVIDWIREQFDQGRWPWFKDEFHPPRAALRETMNGS